MAPPEEEMEQTLDEVTIHPIDQSRKVSIGSRMDPTVRDKMVDFLSTKHYCFAWSHQDMTGINPSIISHRLNVDPKFKPIK